MALYVEGFYGQDQWKVTPGLTFTIGLRMEHNSNPLCRTNCVPISPQDFNSLPTSQSTPYNQLISSGMEKAFFNQQELAWEPRVGFAYQAGSKTTIRGGFGMFADYFPAQIMGDLGFQHPRGEQVYGSWRVLRQWNNDRCKPARQRPRPGICVKRCVERTIPPRWLLQKRSRHLSRFNEPLLRNGWSLHTADLHIGRA